MEVSHFLIFALSLLLGLAAGWLMHRADFCMAGAFRDLFLFRTTFLLRSLLLLVAVGSILYEAGRLAGWFRVPFPLFGPPSGTHLLGGILFGLGMVLAGGCVVGSVYKAGAGSLPSALAVFGIIFGSALYAEIHPAWMTLASSLKLGKDAVTLPQLAGINPGWAAYAWLALFLPLAWRWWKRGEWSRPISAEGSMQAWKAALGIAILGAVSAVVVGMPLGITTGYSKVAAFTEQLVFPAHLSSLTFFAATPLDYQHPLYSTPLRGGAGPQLDAIALIQWPLVAGIFFGAAVSAWRLQELTIKWRAPRRQYVSVFLGGILMGLASRFGAGCNVWHLWGGLAILALPSLLFAAGLLPGAWLGSRLLASYVIRTP